MKTLTAAIAILGLGLGFVGGACTPDEEDKARYNQPTPKEKAAQAAREEAKEEEPEKNPWASLTPSLLGKHDGNCYHVGFSPDGSKLVSTGKDKLIKLWDVSSGRLIRTFEGHDGPVMMADFSPDGKLLVSASHDKTARIWEVATGKVKQVLEDKPPKKMTEEEELEYAKLPPALMNWATFHPNGKQVITASDDFALKLWDVKTGKKLKVFQDDGCRQNRVYRRKDAPGWVSSAGCTFDGVSYIRFWDEEGNQVSSAGDEQHDAHYMAFDSRNKWIIGADGSLSFSIFSAQGSYLKRILVGGYHFCVTFGPDDETLLVGTDRGEIFVYRPGTWKRAGVIDVGEKVGIDSLALSPGDDSLAVALRNGKVLRFSTPVK